MSLHPLIIDIDVVKEKLHGWSIKHNGCLKVHHKAPESRDANEFVLRTLAEAIGMNHSHIHLVHGVESPIKKVKIGKDITWEQLVNILEAKSEKK